MWLFTTYGFVVVEKVTELRNTMMLRSTSEQPLQHLLKRFGTELSCAAVTRSLDTTDTQFQLVCNKNKLAFCLGQMALEIDYTDLKAAVAEDDLDLDYYDALVDVEKRMKESVE